MPPFAVHEAHVIALIARADPRLIPTVLADDPTHRRVLFDAVPGEDAWEAPPELIRAALGRWVAVQAALAGSDGGPVPARPPADLAAGLRALLDGDTGGQLSAGERRAAADLANRLPAVVDALDACGLPATLVHGDFHPGNWRVDGRRLTFLDFGDASIGHPALDGVRLRDFLPPDRRAPVASAWCDAWARHRPGSDPARALALAGPLTHLAGAVRYQEFLDNIEASERRYHEADPADSIRAALAAAGGLSVGSREWT
jgi:Ser/Thr protein kinase RdoA (MazF antagonist)